MRTMIGRKFWWGVASVVTLWLLWMTLRPNPEVAASLQVLTTPAARHGIPYFWLIDIAGNIIVFAPLGAAVALSVCTPRPVDVRILYGTLAGLLLSCTIELLQGLTATRHASLGDVALNTVGAALGAGVAIAMIQLINHQPGEDSCHTN